MLRKTHERELAAVRVVVEEEHKRLVYQLKKQVASAQMELDRAHSQATRWEQQVEQATSQLKKTKRAHALKEIELAAMLRETQDQVRLHLPRCMLPGRFVFSLPWLSTRITDTPPPRYCCD